MSVLSKLPQRYLRVALENHCRLAAETIHPKFNTRRPGYQLCVTVNSGYE